MRGSTTPDPAPWRPPRSPIESRACFATPETPGLNAIETSDPDAGPGSCPGNDPGDADDPAHEPFAPDQPAAQAAGGSAIAVHLEAPAAPADLAPWLVDQIGRAIDHLDIPVAGLSIAVVDDARMIELHTRSHGLDTTTDVLTYDLRNAPADPIEGEVVVCLDEAARQSRAHGHAAREEALLYAIHGLMHLLGEDDHAPADFARMHRREDDLLEALGFARLFGGGGGRP